MTKRPLLIASVLVFLCTAVTQCQSVRSMRSPDGRLEIQVAAADRLSFNLFVNEKLLLRDSTIGMRIDQQQLGLKPKVRSAKESTVDRIIEPPVRQQFASLREHYNEMRLELEGNYAVVFRAYNEGFAYRIETTLPQAEVKVYNEDVKLNFAGNYSVYYPQEESFLSHNERKFLFLSLPEISAKTLASLPAVVDTKEGPKLAVAEADVDDYPGLWLHGNSNNSLSGTFPPYPLKEELTRDRDYKITQAADYIAVTRGTRTFPWRLIGVAEKDGDLITNQLVYLLSRPSLVADTSWIKPGKVAWDWWNANNIDGVDFKSGVNTRTYKYYIDFAAKYGLEYIILDEGWYKLGHQLEVVPEIDIAELTAYGKQKHVGIILWTVWKTLDDELLPALDQFEKWGVKGIKVDFMQRDDQKVMNFYTRVCREAAQRKLLVDFHGAIRPATMTRTWPNLINTEGVKGLENDKWSDEVTPEHDVTLPFTRMFLGPMDFTPGAMRNATKATFAKIFNQPMSQGTRCHQLAMYVVYESPLQMLADTPSNYLREPAVMEFLGPVPSVWDDTRVLEGKIGQYVIVARRHGREWYVGGMTDWTAREFQLDFSFLGAGKFQLDAYQDGVNADRYASDYRRVKSSITSTTKLTIKLAPGGGWAARITPR